MAAKKCRECGASKFKRKGDNLECEFCGSIFTEEMELVSKPPPPPVPLAETDTDDSEEDQNTETKGNDPLGGFGCFVFIILALALTLAFGPRVWEWAQNTAYESGKARIGVTGNYEVPAPYSCGKDQVKVAEFGFVTFEPSISATIGSRWNISPETAQELKTRYQKETPYLRVRCFGGTLREYERFANGEIPIPENGRLLVFR